MYHLSINSDKPLEEQFIRWHFAALQNYNYSDMIDEMYDSGELERNTDWMDGFLTIQITAPQPRGVEVDYLIVARITYRDDTGTLVFDQLRNGNGCTDHEFVSFAE